jgi:NADP-dependent 3-hydroxy acid dehydrogenase YdfG
MILITGATDGIGLETARQLALQAHELVLHGRYGEKTQRNHLSLPIILQEVYHTTPAWPQAARFPSTPRWLCH